VLPPLLLSPQAASVRPTVRMATAGRAVRRREELFTSMLLVRGVWDTSEVRCERWTIVAVSVNAG
jgi:hypothetical protein